MNTLKKNTLRYLLFTSFCCIDIAVFPQSVGIGSVQFVPLQMLEVRGDITIDNSGTDAAFRIADTKVLQNKGVQNIFVGDDAGKVNAGAYNTFLGYRSGYTNSTGSENTFLGNAAGYNNSTGNNNTFMGDSAGFTNTGSFNIFIGDGAGKLSTSNGSCFIGYQAGHLNTSGSSNVFIGNLAGRVNQTSSGNTFIGSSAGSASTFGNNTFIGATSGNKNTTGSYNTYVGSGTGLLNTIGSYNTLEGTFAGFFNGSGGENTAIGYNAMRYATTPSQNTILGFNAGAFVFATSYSGNTFIGHRSGASMITGADNVLVGRNSGVNTNASDNVFIGTDAGKTNTTGTNNTYVGYNADGTAALSNSAAIGYNASVTASNSIVLGDGTANVGIACSAPKHKLHVVGDIAAEGGTIYASTAVINTTITACSDIRFKKNITPISNALQNVLNLQGVNYEWKVKEFPTRHFTNEKQIGFIAQDLEKIFPQFVVTDKEGYKSVDYARLTPVLVEAIKSQQMMIEEMKNQIQKIKSENILRDEKWYTIMKKMNETGEASLFKQEQ